MIKHHRLHDRGIILPKLHKRDLPRQDLVESNPQRVNVHRKRGRVIIVQFGRQPPVRPRLLRHQRRAAARGAEIRDLHLCPCAFHQHVQALDVPVDDLPREVQVHQPCGDSPRDLHSAAPVELDGVVPQQVVERPVHQLHDDEGGRVVAPRDADQQQHVGVSELAPLFELLLELLVGVEELLHGHGRVEIVRAVHRAVGALGQGDGIDDEVMGGDVQAG